MRKIARTLLLMGMMLLPGCLVVTCGSSDLEQREVPAETNEGSF